MSSLLILPKVGAHACCKYVYCTVPVCVPICVSAPYGHQAVLHFSQRGELRSGLTVSLPFYLTLTDVARAGLREQWTQQWSENIQRRILLMELEQRLSLPVHHLTHGPAFRSGFPWPIKFASERYSIHLGNHLQSSSSVLARAGAGSREASLPSISPHLGRPSGSGG